MRVPEFPPARVAAALLLALALVVAGPTPARAQQPVWVALDNAPPGAPAQIVFDTNNSTPDDSFFDIIVHGFWATPRVGPDNLTYQQVQVPGLQVLQTIGAPELPYYPFELGVVTYAGQVLLSNTTVVSVVLLPNFLPWPHAKPAVIDVPGTDELFVREAAIYGGNADFPASNGLGASAVSGLLGTLRAAPGEVYPIHWNPNGTLTVCTDVRYHFSHAGAAAQAEVGSAMVAASALDRLVNAPVVGPWVHWDQVTHLGYYLFIYPAADEAQIAPLVTQKEKRGFVVTTAHVEDVGTTCAAVRAYIESWYSGTMRGGDHYCLLAGDVDVIPFCAVPTTPADPDIQTDDLYGDADADGTDDLGKEVYVGRLSMVDATDLSQQVARILAYEDHPYALMGYDTAALIAYRTNAPGGTGFQDTHEAVRTAAYASSAPAFETVYGSIPGVTNADIDAVAERDGILCYAGHGSTNSWGQWSHTEEDYGIPQVDALVNHPVNPIVWSLTCLTGSIQLADCVAEGWMEQNTDGAVAVYAGTDVTGIGGNLFLETALFKAVFDKGLVIHGAAIEYGEAHGFDMYNAYKYTLLGDPEMHIRRHRVLDPATTYWLLDRPPVVPGNPGDPFDVRVRTRQGVPVSGVQVSLWKPVSPQPTGPARADASRPPAGAAAVTASEVLTNLYTGQDGYAHFQLPALGAGTLFVTVTDDDANTMSEGVPVTAPSGVPGGGPAGALRLAAMPSVTQGGTRIGFGRALDRDVTVSLRDVAGREVRSLAVARGAEAVRWDGANAAGVRVASGLYFAVISGGPAGGAARVIVLR